MARNSLQSYKSIFDSFSDRKLNKPQTIFKYIGEAAFAASLLSFTALNTWDSLSPDYKNTLENIFAIGFLIGFLMIAGVAVFHLGYQKNKHATPTAAVLITLKKTFKYIILPALILSIPIVIFLLGSRYLGWFE